MYIIEGPATIGNVFGYVRPDNLAAGQFVVVEDGEFANGGYGPCQAVKGKFASRAEAEQALAQAK